MRLCTWHGRHDSITSATRRNRHRLSLTALESRDVPAAQWYTVHLDSAPQGTVDSTAASITSGSLHVDPTYDPSNTGTALVYADSATDAIRTALTGGVVVNLSAVSLPPASYTFTEGTSSPNATDHMAFAVTPMSASSAWKVYLEDLTADPTVSDWDYNDFFWTVSVLAIDPATIQYVSIVADAPDAVIQPNTSTPTSFTIRRESHHRRDRHPDG